MELFFTKIRKTGSQILLNDYYGSQKLVKKHYIHMKCTEKISKYRHLKIINVIIKNFKIPKIKKKFIPDY